MGIAGEKSMSQGPTQLNRELPTLLSADEVATLLRTSRTAVYMMAYRNQLPGLTRLGRRILFRQDDLLNWLDRSRASSPTGR